MSSERKPRHTKPLSRVRNRVVETVRNAEDRASHSERRRVRASLYVWRVCVLLVAQWKRDRCPQQAAGLSFQSVLSVVPALALAMAAFRATGAMEAESSLIKFLSREYLPLSAEEISQKLLSLSANITFESMGLIGLITTLLIAFFTFNSLEQAINQIWRVEKRRSLPRRLVAFYLTTIVGSALVGMSLYQAAQFGLSDGWSGIFLSVGIAFGGLFLANIYLPATKVRTSAALVGAAVTTILSEVAKLGFTAYVTRFAMDKYSGVYGPMAAVPLCLVWIYWSWLMLLLGVVVTHSMQNLRLLEGAKRRVQVDLAEDLERSISGRSAAALMAVVAKAQSEGLVGVSRFRISQDCAMSDDAIRLLTDRLGDAELLNHDTATGLWSLARSADQISVLEVFDAFQGTDDEESVHFEASKAKTHADQALAALVESSRNAAKNYTIASLNEGDDQAEESEL